MKTTLIILATLPITAPVLVLRAAAAFVPGTEGLMDRVGEVVFGTVANLLGN